MKVHVNQQGVSNYSFDSWANNIAAIPLVRKWSGYVIFPHPSEKDYANGVEIANQITNAIHALVKEYGSKPVNATFTRNRETTRTVDRWIISMTVIEG